MKAGVTCVHCGMRQGEFHSLVAQQGEEYTMSEPNVAHIQAETKPDP